MITVENLKNSVGYTRKRYLKPCFIYQPKDHILLKANSIISGSKFWAFGFNSSIPSIPIRSFFKCDETICRNMCIDYL